jgi:undecaprenyl-diphosphatase
VSVLVVVMIGVLVTDDPGPVGPDRAVARALGVADDQVDLRDHDRVTGDPEAGRVIRLGSPAAVVLGAALLLATALAARDGVRAVTAVVAPAGSGVLAELLVPALFPREIRHSGPGFFPSSHAAGSCALALVALFLAIRHLGRPGLLVVGPLAGVGVLLVGAALVRERQHYATDVMAGWAIATAVTCATLVAARAALGHRGRSPVA